MLLGPMHVRAQEESVGFYAVMTLPASAVEQDLQMRFKGRGKALFLVRDVRVGVSSGDLIRFEDKAVLIDASVMQTLQASGALKQLRRASVLRLQAKSQSSVWQARSSLVQNSREQKAYRLGGEVLKVFEDYFGKAPAAEKIILNFTGKDMEMIVPDALMDRLTFATVRKVAQGGKPLMVSAPPVRDWFAGDSLAWRAWGADPTSPETELRYGAVGELPPGLSWVDSLHGFSGTLDSVGDFSVGAWVRNPTGGMDSMEFPLQVRTNQLPRIFAANPPPVISDSNYFWHVPVDDPDHAAGLLRCFGERVPAGFILDSLCDLQGLVGQDWSGEDTLVLRVSDPLGAEELGTVVLKKPEAVANPLRAIKFLLPMDTLVAGQLKEWSVRDLVIPGIQILRVFGFDSIVLSGAKLRVRPKKAGRVQLSFLLASGMDTVKLTQALVVSKNSPPVFRSALSADQVKEGTRLSYKPVVVDPDGDSVRLTAVNIEGDTVAWVDGEVPLWTRSPGSYSLEVYADDGLNPPVPQRIAWNVESDRREWNGLGTRRINLAAEAYYWLFFRKGSGRFGLFSPKLSQVMASAPMSEKEWPYFVAGGSLLGERGMARGNWLYLDMGLQLRNPTQKLITGGFMIGLDGHWISSNKARPWVFELEVNAHSNQAILVVDTSGWEDTELVLTLNQEVLSLGNIDTDSLLYEMFGPAYSKIMSDASQKQNTVLLTRIEGLFPVAKFETLGMFLAGVVVWREDYLNTLSLNQWMGVSLRHQVEWRVFNLTQTIRYGLFTGGVHAGVRYDLQMNLGIWR
jgi:hypothetical protein